MATILISGANRGIGLEMAKQYAGDGWDVIGTARDAGAARELLAIKNAKVMQLDVADRHSQKEFMAELGDQPVDLYIHNAGIFHPKVDDRRNYSEVFQVNSVAPPQMAAKLKDHVLKGETKKMIVISSIAGSIDSNNASDDFGADMMYYKASKAAVNQAWKTLSNNWKDDGLTLAMLHPGWVQTDMGGENADITPQESVTGMRKVIDDLTHDQTGSFRNYDGAQIPW